MSTIYFRPATAQPYHILRAAKWLTRLGHFKDSDTAYNFLQQAENTNLVVFRRILNQYYDAHQLVAGYLVKTDDSAAFRSARGPYGNEDHMYYRREYM